MARLNAMDGIDRREFVKGGLVAGLGASLGVKSAQGAAPAPTRKPNVLYVFDDQHRAASLPGEPFSQVLAPNIDKFRRANMSMDQCISNYPLCCPYRAIMMTGKYSPENGVVNNAVAMRTSEFTLSKAFKQAGYRTSYVGKWHLAGDHDMHFKFIPEGPGRVQIDDWHIWEDTNNHYHCYTFDSKTGKQIPATTWAPVNMTDEVLGLFKSYAQDKDQPWILWVSYNPPHPPFNPPESDAALNPIPQQKYRPNVVAGSGPKFMKSLEAYHKAMQGYLGGISGIDIEFGRILKALDESGMANDTIVIFTSDHGEMMGSQGKGGKIVPWEESNHVPFMVRYPGVTPKGGSSNQLFAAVDIYPTVCGLAGIPVPEHCSGRDMSDALRGKKVANAPDTVFLMGAPGGDGGDEAAGTPEGATGAEENESTPAAHAGKKGAGWAGAKSPLYYRGVRTAQYTYTVREDGRWLLYDNLADPYQMKNLVGDAGHKALMEGFDAQIQGWIKKTGDVFVYPRV